MRKSLIAALAATTALALSFAPAQAQPNEHARGGERNEPARAAATPPAPPPAPRAAPPPAARPAGPPPGMQFDRGRAGGPFPVAPQFDRGRLGGLPPVAPQFDRGRPGGPRAESFDRGRSGGLPPVAPQFDRGRPAGGAPRGESFDRERFDRGRFDQPRGQGFDRGRFPGAPAPAPVPPQAAPLGQRLDPNRAFDQRRADQNHFQQQRGLLDPRQGDRNGFDGRGEQHNRQRFDNNGGHFGNQSQSGDNRQRFEDGRDHHDGERRDGERRDGDHHDGDNRQRFEGGYEGGERHARDFEHERREYEHDHVNFNRYGADPDRYRHDYIYHEWREREYDPVRLQIINQYGYNPFGYGLGNGFNANTGWGFDLRFGYWYGPQYYDPGYNFWYGPRTYYRYGVTPEELISRDSHLYDWALRWFDYDGDGYLEREELHDAAQAFRQFADFDGNGYIDGREYRYALDRIDGYSPRG